MTRILSALAMAVVVLAPLAACTSLVKGTVQALLDGSGEPPDGARQCFVRGPAFGGIKQLLARQDGFSPGSATPRPPVLKVLMVHGTGEHEPGYSTRLVLNLANMLGLDVVAERSKRLTLSAPLYRGQPLGMLQISRYTDKQARHEMLFYELTWSQVTAAEKQAIAYDIAGESSSRRAEINNLAKIFFNGHISDPLIYLGPTQDRIKLAVTQSLCWLMSRDWGDLPDRATRFCDARQPTFLTELDDDYVFVTHSLGSRIVTDAMQLLAQIVEQELRKRPSRNLRAAAAVLQRKRLPVFMLANQLPLLQLGQVKPQVTGRHQDYCTPGGAHYEQRIFKELTLVAFSDPNDILSYALHSEFVDTYMDSRLCPSVANVILKVAKEVDLLGFGRLANPLDAHNEYENDARVIALIAGGIGRDGSMSMLQQQCEWLETR